MDKETKSRSVWVGNINYDVTEQQVKELFASVGPVLSIRLLADRDTGKPRGYGFIEFSSHAEAASAVRNLNHSDLHGRSLKVAFADDENAGGGMNKTNKPSQQTSNTAASIGSLSSANPHYSNPNQPYASGEITKLLRTLTKAEMIEILNETRRFCVQNPEGAKQLILDTPQLAQTLLQMQILFGLVKADDVKAMEIAAAAHAANFAQPQTTGPMAHYAAGPQPGPPMGLPLPPQPPMAPMAPMAPMVHPHPHAPLLPHGHPEPEFLLRLPQQEQNVLRELLHLNPEQIKQLPQHVQQQVFAILQQMGLPIPR